MNSRIREVREHLDLTLKKFSELIGISEGALSNIENSKRKVTPQMFQSVCREFNVNPEWLQTGNGEMFKPIQEDKELEFYFGRISSCKDEQRKKILKNICKLSDEQWEVLKSIILDLKKE